MTAATSTSVETDTPTPDEAPLVYLGMRRGWWVVASLLLLCAVDALPLVGPYLALAVLMWMVAGLARAKPRAAHPARVGRAERVERHHTDLRRGGEAALPSS